MLEFITNHAFASYVLIFFARVIDVSLDVFRLLLVTRGYAWQAALIGFVEIIIYVIALGSVLTGGSMDFYKILAYAGGFASGTLIGTSIEERVAVGYTAVQIFCGPQVCANISAQIRSKNFGVTRISGEGRSGPRDILIVTAKRRDLPHMLALLDEIAPDTFYSISDVRSLRGGIFPHRRL